MVSTRWPNSCQWETNWKLVEAMDIISKNKNEKIAWPPTCHKICSWLWAVATGLAQVILLVPLASKSQLLVLIDLENQMTLFARLELTCSIGWKVRMLNQPQSFLRRFHTFANCTQKNFSLCWAGYVPYVYQGLVSMYISWRKREGKTKNKKTTKLNKQCSLDNIVLKTGCHLPA